MTLKLYKHAPAHLLIDDQVYFFTGALYQKRPLLESDEAKQILQECLFRFHEKFGWTNREWAILNNHYHFLSIIPKGKDIPRMINSMHKTSAFHIMRRLNLDVKPFWYQYWDRCIRNGEDYNRTVYYILYNPLKHGLTENPEQYRFSSYRDRLSDEEKALVNLVRRYKSEEEKDFEEVDDF